MKKLFALMLALVMVISLCACGNKNTADGTKPSETPTTGTPTEGKTDATQPSGEGGATQPSEGGATTPAPTTPAPTTPAPTTCSHSWKDATCNAPKTCTKCNATEGSALSHSYENGSCSKCGEADNRVPFSDHVWQMDALNGNQLYRINLDCYKGMGMVSVSFWSEVGQTGDPYQFEGKTYHEDGFGGEGELTYMEEGDTVKLTITTYDGMSEGTLTLQRANATQYTVTAVTGTIISANITSAIQVGSAFTVFVLNIE